MVFRSVPIRRRSGRRTESTSSPSRSRAPARPTWRRRAHSRGLNPRSRTRSRVRPGPCRSARRAPQAARLRQPPAWQTARPAAGEPTARIGIRVLAAQGAEGEHDDATRSTAASSTPRFLRAFDRRPRDQAVRQLRGARAAARPAQRATAAASASSSGGQLTTPHARAFPADEQPGDQSTSLGGAETSGGGDRVDQVDVVEAHPPERAVELAAATLLGPELPPELVGDDDLVAPPARRRGTARRTRPRSSRSGSVRVPVSSL